MTKKINYDKEGIIVAKSLAVSRMELTTIGSAGAIAPHCCTSGAGNPALIISFIPALYIYPVL